MILKSYEINKINLLKNRYLLLYGVNEGAKSEFTTEIVRKSNMNQNKIDIKNSFLIIFSFLLEYTLWNIFGSMKVIIAINDHEKIYPIEKSPVSFKWLFDTLLIINDIPPYFFTRKNKTNENPKYIKINWNLSVFIIDLNPPNET